MFDGIDCDIDIQVRPMKMIRRKELNVCQLPDGRVFKPRESCERQEQLSLIKEYPEA